MSISAQIHDLAGRPRLPAAIPLLALMAALALVGCGDDSSETTGTAADAGATPTATNLAPDDEPSTIPALPDNDDPTAIVCTGTPQVGDDGEIAGVFDATAVVGKKLETAEKQASAQGCQIRVAMKDGEGLALTQDFRPDRVNVAVENGKVTEIVDIG